MTAARQIHTLSASRKLGTTVTTPRRRTKCVKESGLTVRGRGVSTQVRQGEQDNTATTPQWCVKGSREVGDYGNYNTGNDIPSALREGGKREQWRKGRGGGLKRRRSQRRPKKRSSLKIND